MCSDRCGELTEFGACRQPTDGGLCSYHEQTGTHDRYYHRKIVLVLTVPTWDWMTARQAKALLAGRAHNDGRPLDAWVISREGRPPRKT